MLGSMKLLFLIFAMGMDFHEWIFQWSNHYLASVCTIGFMLCGADINKNNRVQSHTYICVTLFTCIEVTFCSLKFEVLTHPVIIITNTDVYQILDLPNVKKGFEVEG